MECSFAPQINEISSQITSGENFYERMRRFEQKKQENLSFQKQKQETPVDSEGFLLFHPRILSYAKPSRPSSTANKAQENSSFSNYFPQN